MATTVYVRETTKAKLDAIAKERRWSTAETIDVLADEYIKTNDISVQLPRNTPNDTAA